MKYRLAFGCYLIFQAFLHISTLYSNCDRKMIEEKVYESDIAYEKIIQVSMGFIVSLHHTTFAQNLCAVSMEIVNVCRKFSYENCLMATKFVLYRLLCAQHIPFIVRDT